MVSVVDEIPAAASPVLLPGVSPLHELSPGAVPKTQLAVGT